MTNNNTVDDWEDWEDVHNNCMSDSIESKIEYDNYMNNLFEYLFIVDYVEKDDEYKCKLWADSEHTAIRTIIRQQEEKGIKDTEIIWCYQGHKRYRNKNEEKYNVEIVSNEIQT